MVVRGSQSFNVPRSELSDLLTVLRHLAEEADYVPLSTPDDDGRPRRGELWKRVQVFLEGADRAQGFKSVLRAVGGDASGRSDIEHPLRVLLGRRVASGDLEISPAGRYRLIE